MPTLSVANHHVFHTLLSSCFDVGIVFQSAYDLVVRAYRGTASK